MDWVTFGSSLAGSGVVGVAASLLVVKVESRDRRAALALEREKFDYERRAPDRETVKVSCDKALQSASQMAWYLAQKRHDAAEFRAIGEAAHAVGLELAHAGLLSAAGAYVRVNEQWQKVVQAGLEGDGDEAIASEREAFYQEHGALIMAVREALHG